jgi:hypothetical protein
MRSILTPSYNLTIIAPSEQSISTEAIKIVFSSMGVDVYIYTYIYIIYYIYTSICMHISYIKKSARRILQPLPLFNILVTCEHLLPTCPIVRDLGSGTLQSVPHLREELHLKRYLHSLISIAECYLF